MPGGEKNVCIKAPGPSADLVLVEESIPECPPHGVIIKSKSAGMCHSDIHLWEDKWRISDEIVVSLTALNDKVKFPMILGHELCGEIYAVGKDVGDTDVAIGDQVVVFPWVGCKECNLCSSGRGNVCDTGGATTNFGLGAIPGGFQSYVAVDAMDYVLKVSRDIPPNIACMFGCSALTAYNVVDRARGSIEKAAQCGEAHYLIIGAGGLGLWCIQLARAVYPPNTKIFIADISEDKLALAKEHGADDVILWSKGDDEKELIEKTKRITGGIDGSADFVGLPATCIRAFEVTNKGATMCLIGFAGGTFPVSIFRIITKDVRVAGTISGTKQQMQELVQIYTSNKLKPPPLIEIEPKEANDTIHKLHQGKIAGRAIINF